MIFPMRRFGLNADESLLSSVGKACSLLVLGAGASVAVWQHFSQALGFVGGALVALSLATGALLNLGSGGVRQNRSPLNLALALLALLAGVWLTIGIWRHAWLPTVVGTAFGLMWGLCRTLRRRCLALRFRPRFFSLRQFETMINIADTMIAGDHLVIHPIEIAVRADHLLAQIDSPLKRDIKLAMVLLEWVLPLLSLRVVPFSALGTHERRLLIERTIWSRGLLQDVARLLKLLPTISYYTDDAVRAAIGYVAYEDRPRAAHQDPTPKHYHLPTIE